MNLYILLLSTLIASLLVFFVFKIVHRKKTKKKDLKIKKPVIITSHDIRAISGENPITTQLDLARAYIEMDKFNLAKKILAHVIEHGQPIQKQEAHELISSINKS